MNTRSVQPPGLRLLALSLVAAGAAFCTSGCGKEISPEQRQADSTFTSAREAFAEGDFQMTQRLLRQAYAMDEDLARPARQAEEQQLLATTFRTLALFDSAIAAYGRAVDLYKAVADRNAARSMALEIAGIHQYIGEEHRAFALYSEALRLARVFGDAGGVLEIQWAMLPSCRSTGNREEENRALGELLDAYTASGDVDRQGKVYFETGISSLYYGEHAGALEHFLRALTFAEQSRDSLLAISALLKIGVTYEKMGQTFEAFQSFSDGLRRSDRAGGAAGLREEMLIRIGNIYLGNGQESEAARFYRAALNSAIRMKNKVAEGFLFLQLGHCMIGNTTQRDDAIRNYESALALFQGISFGRGKAYAQFSLGNAAERARQFSEAVQHYGSALTELEQLQWRPDRDDLYRDCEEAFYRRLQTTPQEAIVALLLELGRYEEAFWYMERRQGNHLYEVLANQEAVTPDRRLTTLLDHFRHTRFLLGGAERHLRDLLASGGPPLDALPAVGDLVNRRSRSLEDLRDSVVEIAPSMEAAVRIRNIGLAEVQRLLPPGVAFVEHVATPRSLYMFVATNTRAAVRLAAAEKNLVRSQVGEFVRMLRMRELYVDSTEIQQRSVDARIQELTSSLYQIFVRPMEGDIGGASKIEVVLQQEFEGMPLHALRRGAGRGNPYLAERALVRYLPAAFTLGFRSTAPPRPRPTAKNPEAPPQKEILAVGHTGTSGWDVEYELRDIRAFFKDARFLFGQQATLAALRQERGDILHLALEFRFDDRNPENSYVLLSDGKAFNTTAPVFWGSLFSIPPFPTVVVSDLAEDRATVRPALPYILLANGTTAVIDQMYVPMRKTKKYFGEVFYTTLLTGASSEAAFRQMQLEMIRNPEYSAPFIWAPFGLWGK
jgi:CHAT domain-containing protein/tetratricopeptide (TPR) repeat protein